MVDEDIFLNAIMTNLIILFILLYCLKSLNLNIQPEMCVEILPFIKHLSEYRSTVYNDMNITKTFNINSF